MPTHLFRFLLLLICSVTLSACDGICPISWSTDGRIMTFIAGGLRLGDASGQLTEILLPDATQAKWLNDSQHLLVVTSSKIRTWSQCLSYLSPQQQKDAIELSQLLKQRMLQSKDIDSCWQESEITHYPRFLNGAAVLYLKQDQDLALKKKLVSDHYKIIWDTDFIITGLSLIQVADNHITNKKDLWHGFTDIKDMRIAPDGKFTLLILKNEDDSNFNIFLISLDYPRTPWKIAESIAAHADWSTDSQQIYIATADHHQDSQPILGSLDSIRIRDKQGFPLKVPETPVPLLYSLIDPSSDIASLPDGRILFTAPNVELPTTEKDISQTKNVFCFKPGSQLVNRLMPRPDAQAMHNIDSITVNPAGTWVAAFNADQGNLVLLNIATGETICRDATPALIPSWRNSDEICFFKSEKNPNAKKDQSEIVLFSLSTKAEQKIGNQVHKIVQSYH